MELNEKLFIVNTYASDIKQLELFLAFILGTPEIPWTVRNVVKMQLIKEHTWQLYKTESQFLIW